MKCPNCNREVANDKFCGFCGTPLSGVSDPAPTTGNSSRLKSSFKKAPDLSSSAQLQSGNSGNSAVMTYESQNQGQNSANSQGSRFVSTFDTAANSGSQHSDIATEIPTDKTLVSRDEFSPGERAVIKSKKRKSPARFIVLVVVLSILAIAIGSVVGYFAANGKIPFLSEGNSNFHWSDTPPAYEVQQGE